MSVDILRCQKCKLALAEYYSYNKDGTPFTKYRCRNCYQVYEDSNITSPVSEEYYYKPDLWWESDDYRPNRKLPSDVTKGGIADFDTFSENYDGRLDRIKSIDIEVIDDLPWLKHEYWDD